MAIRETKGGGIIATGPASTHAVRFAVLVTALRLEINGIRPFRGAGSAYQSLKRELKMTGTKVEVLRKAEEVLDTMQKMLGSVQGEQ